MAVGLRLPALPQGQGANQAPAEVVKLLQQVGLVEGKVEEKRYTDVMIAHVPISAKKYRELMGQVRPLILASNDVPFAGVVELVAYYTLRADTEGLDHQEIYARLRERLPGYMVPRIRVVDVLPRTATGKIARRALAESVAG